MSANVDTKGTGSRAHFRLSDAAKSLAGKLNKQIEMGHESTAFSIAIMLAIMKDALDLGLDAVLIGLIPVVGQLPGYFLSAVLTYFLWGKGWFLKSKMKIIYLVCSVFFDNLPLFNALPLNTINVLYAWKVVKESGESAAKTMENLHALSEKELAELNEEHAAYGI